MKFRKNRIETKGKNIRNIYNKGITLITLVITIILLIILAGIIINVAIGKRGIIQTAKETVETYKMQYAKEKLELSILSYKTNQENTTLLEELRKIEGIDAITTNNEELPYIVIIDGFEFKIDTQLKVTYEGEKQVSKSESPEINVEYEKGEVYTLVINIKVKTKDSLGLKELVISRKVVNGTTEKYQNVKVEQLTGQEGNIQVEIPINGEYVIQAYGKNNTITKQEIIINNIKEGSILASISAGTVIDNHVVLTVIGKSEGFPVKQMEVYAGGKQVKIYEYQDEQEEKEEQYILENIEFYQDTPCYVKVINKKDKQAISEEVFVTNKKVIANVKDLENFATQVNSGNTFASKTIYLIDEITTNRRWIPIGYHDGTGSWAGKYFAGTFEGNNHTITVTNLTTDNIKYKSNGLFGMVIGGNIRNLVVGGETDAHGDYIAGIVGAIKNGTIYNCTNKAEVDNILYMDHGGIAGLARNTIIENCTNNATIYGKTNVGGIVGANDENSKIINCNNSGKIMCYGTGTIKWGNSKGDFGAVGGMVGLLRNSNVENCTNTGEIIGNKIVGGGIVGWADSSNIKKCNNKGMVNFFSGSETESSSGAVGGISGGLISSNIEQCYNIAKMTGKVNGKYVKDNIGGISGYIVNSYIKNVYNRGIVEGKTNIGGIVAAADSVSGISGKNYIDNCYNAVENVVGTSNVGNLAGKGENVVSYYVSFVKDKAPLGTNVNSKWNSYTQYTIAQMKTMNAGLLDLMSKGAGNGLWSQSSSINDGFPYLVNNRP
ncbi:MAG: hypothetical protein HFJ42_08325 [Clostridia bacterium]|nr:hypothetical protein [Clostridia bacterium]